MAITIANSTTYDGGFLATHTISNFNGSGTNSYTLVSAHNKNPTVEDSGTTADGNSMTLIDTNENANVVAVRAYGYEINDSSFDIVNSTPSFKEQAMVAINLNGVDQTTNYNSTVTKAGSFSTSATASVTGTAGSMLLILGGTQTDQTLTASNCTAIQTFSPSSGIGAVFTGYVEATGSSQTVGFTFGTSDNWRLTIIEFYAAVSGLAWITA